MPASPAPPPVKGIVPASLHERQASVPAKSGEDVSYSELPSAEPANRNATGQTASGGTVVLDVEQGGIVVPSFIGKTVRTAIETAEDNGLDLDVVGSGMGRQQNPLPGTHVQSGARVTVSFGR
jgi:cell division protein FtsI (penicillin-binding protein 3)